MNVIKRSTIEWINLLSRLHELKIKYGYSLFHDTIICLDCLEHQKMMSIGVKSQLLDLLVEHEIDHLSLMKLFLVRIESIYNLESVIVKIREAQTKYGLDSIAFVLDDPLENKVVSTFYSKYGYQKAYFPKDIIPFTQVDFKAGEMKFVVNPYTEFIVDKKDRQQLERIFYTNDFRFGSESLPLKAEMDYYDAVKEKRYWMDHLIFNLSYLGNSNIELLVQDPNIQYYDVRPTDVYENYTVLTDGLIMDSNGRELVNRTGYFSEVVVKDADVLMICQINHGEITNIKLIVHPLYFKDYIKELDDNNEKGILASVLAMLDNTKRKSMNGLSR